MKLLTKNYWKKSLTELKSVKVLVIASIFIALKIAISSIYIPIPNIGTQRIYFSFIVTSLGCAIYGPIVGALSGLVGDILGYLIFPQGAFFIGYTITAIVSGFIYGIFFYKTKVTLLNISICKFLINMLLNVVLNGLWDSILIGSNYFALVISRIPKNLIMLPIEIFIMYILFKRVIPILEKRNIINYDLNV
ncbi:MAG: folate family ECF transporter S component [Clostridia bacterium]